MGYIFAFAAVFCGAAKGFGGKKISAYTAKLSWASYLNFIRMIMCIAIGFVLALISDGAAVFAISPKLLFIAAFSGTMTAAMAISWLFAVRGGAYMMVDVFLTVGVTVPMILSSIFYGEKITLSGIIGLLILFCAAAILCSYSSSVKKKIRIRDVIAILIAAITNGLIGFSQKMFNHSIDGVSALTFNFYVYVFSAISLGAFFLITKDKQHKACRQMPTKVYAFVTMMALCLFGHSFFNTVAASKLTALELYPLSQGSGLILSTLMASIFFGEKIRVRLVIGVFLAFTGILLINLL